MLMPVEIETKLIVISKDPESVFAGIESLTTIGGYTIMPAKKGAHHDRYLDTQDKSLMKNRVALRLRDYGKTLILCMKKDKEQDNSAATKRIEIEAPWSGSCLREIIPHICEDIHIKTDLPTDVDDPLRTLNAMGFHVIQDRQTMRSIINIIDPDKRPATLIAEMALDTVSYRFDDLSVHHYEVEIEAKENGSEDMIVQITGTLREKFGEELRPWPHNKLITGMTIDMLHKKGMDIKTCKDKSFMSPSMYERIDAEIRRTGSSVFNQK